jgi:cell division protein FtsI (penicillin-binding protein 3)
MTEAHLHGPRAAAPNPTQVWRWLGESVWRVEHAFERSKAEGRAVDDTRIRICVVLTIFAMAFVVLGVEAGKSALFSKAGGGGSVAAAPAEARADLLDRQGRLLALNLDHFGLYLDPREIWDKNEIRRDLTAILPKLPRDRLENALASNRREYLMGDLSPQERNRVRNLGLPGVSFEPEDRRFYPLGRSAAHLIGYADLDGKGVAGAERALDDQVRADAGGPGVKLSIDLRIQAALEDELAKAVQTYHALAGVGVISDVHTGEILGLSSMPDFDPNDIGASDPNALVNRAAGSVYEMGSTFKIFTFAMGLDTHTATINSTYDATAPLHIGSRVIHDYHATNRVMTLEDIFLHSSNIGTARLALDAGAAKLSRYFKAFGLLDPAKVELAESTRPIVPRIWSEDTVASASFGHAISVSPLAVVAGVGAIMNGGTYVPLTIAKRGSGPIAGAHRVVSPETSRAMLDLMRMNVLRGSGGKADAPGLRVGGKTGSAEKAIGGKYERSRLVSSFAAVFPTDGPLEAKRYMVLILLDEPKGEKETFGFATAGWNAAPTAGKVIDRIAPFLGVARAPISPFDEARRRKADPYGDEESGAL